MNHGQLAAEALRFRLDTLAPTVVDATRFDVERAAEAAVASADPVIDSALRRIGTAWMQAGLPAEELTHPWTDPRIHSLFRQRPELVDALDDIVARVSHHVPCT